MSDIKALDSLSGTISGKCELAGSLCVTQECELAGSLCVTQEYDAYDDSYEIVPKAFQSQTLETKDRVMKENLVIKEVPYWVTSNESNGETAYIAEEIK